MDTVSSFPWMASGCSGGGRLYLDHRWMPYVQNSEAEGLVLKFNRCINARDLAGLQSLMTEDHVFIDTAAQRVMGRSASIEAWRGFFAAFPDYQNVFELMQMHQDFVVVIGRSLCSDPRLDGPALWTAKIRGSLLCEWRVYEDTVENRANLHIDAVTPILDTPI